MGGVLMTELGTPIDAGADAAMDRAERNGLDVPSRDDLQPFLDRVAEVVEEWPGSHAFNTRAVSLYVENVTVAAISRHNYDEKQLDRQELKAFLGICEWIFNSWWHV
jgi:hypothetical protein